MEPKHDDNIARTEADATSALAACFQSTRDMGGIPGVILPRGYNVHLLDKALPKPVRKKGTTALLDANSFISVVNDQQSADTRLYSTLTPPSFTAVFNATATDAGWGDHRATYVPPLAAEWETWKGYDKRPMNQVQMAVFLENNLPDIAKPDGAQLLEICRTLQAKKTADFSSKVNLVNGSNEFTYNEEVKGTALAGTVSIPEQFEIVIPVFENGAKYLIDARLRYTVDGGKLSIWYELVRPHKTLEDAVNKMRDLIGTETKLPILNGNPPNA